MQTICFELILVRTLIWKALIAALIWFPSESSAQTGVAPPPNSPNSPTLRISIQHSTNRSVVISWAPPQATLQCSPTLAGFSNVAGATTPYRVDTRLASGRAYRACLPTSAPTIYLWRDAMSRVVLDWWPRSSALQQSADLLQWQATATPATDWYYPTTPLEPPPVPGGVQAGMRAFRLGSPVAGNWAVAGVFSVNILGYANLAFRVGQSNYFSFILRDIDTSLNRLLPLPDEADGTTLHFYDPVTQAFTAAGTFIFIGDGVGWVNAVDESSMVNLATQSAGLMIPRSSQPGTTHLFVTTVGEFPQGSFHRSLPPGQTLHGPLIPLRGGITSTHGLQPNDDDLLLLFNPATRDFDVYLYFLGFEWVRADDFSSEEPIVGPGDAFFYVNTSDEPLIWNAFFTISP